MISIIEDYNNWVENTSERSNSLYIDLLLPVIMFIPCLFFFYLSEWAAHGTLFLLNFDEMGALSFVISWMPDFWLFNIIKGVFFCWDFVSKVLVLYIYFVFIFQFLTSSCKTFFIKTIWRIIYVLCISILYFDKLGEWFIMKYNPSAFICNAIEKCYFGYMLKDSILFSFPIAVLLSLCFYMEPSGWPFNKGK